MKVSVAILYQALPAPKIEGDQKPMKPGGYSDSGADIAYTLSSRGVHVVTPRQNPDPRQDLDWVFPDTPEGIGLARDRGANVLWANTVLFRGHPLEGNIGSCSIVGQPPALVDRFDNKWVANEFLRTNQNPVVKGILVGGHSPTATLSLEDAVSGRLTALGFQFPLVVKPVRGRGSEGVRVVVDVGDFLATGSRLLSEYGSTFIAEEFIGGDELTVTVMPPGSYGAKGCTLAAKGYWALPPVGRFNHRDGVAPYSGVVQVIENSRALTDVETRSPAVSAATSACVSAAMAVGAKAPVRIDCRQNEAGQYLIFDFNLKPNMTGAGRPGREKQDSLVCLAARAIGWSYADLLENMLRQSWRPTHMA